MLLMPDELEEQKRLEAERAKAEQAQAEQAQQAPAAPPAMTAPVAPLTPWERMEEEHGTGGSILRILGTGLSGGILGDALMPEMTKAGQAQYASDLKAYQGQTEAYTMAQALAGIDPENLTPGHIALADQFGGSALSDYYTDMYRAQQSGIGGDEAIADHFKYTPYQWSQLSPEKRRDLTDRYNYETNGEGAFDYRLNAQGKAPDQLQQAKEAELYGSGVGQQLAADREIIIGTQSSVEMLDASAAKIKGVREILEDNPDAAGWNRVFRDAFNINTETDGVLSEAEANGVVEQIKQATFGAISQAELDLLRQALMDPTKSTEFNIGTLSSALKTVQDKRKQVISNGRQAVDRYSANETQTDFETLMKSDWAYNNIGGGSRIQPIPAFGGLEEFTFQQYVEETMSSLGPFDPKPSRDDLVNGFAKEREDAEASYEEMIEKERADAEAARMAHERLQRPFGTKK